MSGILFFIFASCHPLRAWFFSGLYGLLIMPSISCCVFFMPICFDVWYWNKVWYDMIWYVTLSSTLPICLSSTTHHIATPLPLPRHAWLIPLLTFLSSIRYVSEDLCYIQHIHEHLTKGQVKPPGVKRYNIKKKVHLYIIWRETKKNDLFILFITY